MRCLESARRPTATSWPPQRKVHPQRARAASWLLIVRMLLSPAHDGLHALHSLHDWYTGFTPTGDIPTCASTVEGTSLSLTLPSGYSTLSDAWPPGCPAAAATGSGPSTSSTGRPTGRMWHWCATEMAVRTWSPVTMAVRICSSHHTKGQMLPHSAMLDSTTMHAYTLTCSTTCKQDHALEHVSMGSQQDARKPAMPLPAHTIQAVRTRAAGACYLH
jgi:hypothetical protein